MIKWYPVLFLFGVMFVSCSVYSGLRKKRFSYAENGGTQSLRVLVPKRYARRETSAGSSRQDYYYYPDGAVLYFIQTTDTLTLFQPIDTANQIPLPHPYGGLMYKGLDSAGRFWREVRTDSFRFGYRFVPGVSEIRFDSAVNYAGMRRFVK